MIARDEPSRPVAGAGSRGDISVLDHRLTERRMREKYPKSDIETLTREGGESFDRENTPAHRRARPGRDRHRRGRAGGARVEDDGTSGVRAREEHAPLDPRARAAARAVGRGEREHGGGRGVREPRIPGRRDHVGPDPDRDGGGRQGRLPRRHPLAEVGCGRADDARRRPARHADLPARHAVVRADNGDGRRPEVQAADVHAVHRRGRRRPLAHHERARAEPELEVHLRRRPVERGRLRRRRPERPDREDDLPRHRRVERERQRGGRRSLSHHRRRLALGSRSRLAGRRREARDRRPRDRPEQREPHPDRHRRGRQRQLRERRRQLGDPGRASDRAVRVDRRRRHLHRLADGDGARDPVRPGRSGRCVRRLHRRRPLALGGRRRGGNLAADLPGHALALHVLGGQAAEQQDPHLPRRGERRRLAQPGLPGRRRACPGGVADGDEQPRVAAALEPGRRRPALRQLRLLRQPAGSAVHVRHVRIVAPRPPRHGRDRRAHVVRRAAAVRRPWERPFRGPRGAPLDRRRRELDRPDRRRTGAGRVDAPRPARDRVRPGQPGRDVRRLRRRRDPDERQVQRHLVAVRLARPQPALPRRLQGVAEAGADAARADQRRPGDAAVPVDRRQPAEPGGRGPRRHAGQRLAQLPRVDDVVPRPDGRRRRRRLRPRRPEPPLPLVLQRLAGHQLRGRQPADVALGRRPDVGGRRVRVLLADDHGPGPREDDLRRRDTRLPDAGPRRRPRVPRTALQHDVRERQGRPDRKRPVR